VLIANVLLLLFFTAESLISFYILYEAVLFPTFLIVGIYGSRPQRVGAAFLLYVYTLIPSLGMLCAFIYIVAVTGEHHFQSLYVIQDRLFSEDIRPYIWFLVFAGLAVKIPLVPIHLWLPIAHVEAPTVGSVILAALILKMGGYGMLKVLIPIHTLVSVEAAVPVVACAIAGMILTGLAALRQTDIKRVIAYSSIVHMSYAMCGLFTMNAVGIGSAIYAMFAHGVISGGLFFAVGIIYERYAERNLYYYNGLADVMPVLAFSFFVLILGNMGLPGTAGFIGEIGVLIGLFALNHAAALLCLPILILNGTYNIWLATRLLFGPARIGSVVCRTTELVPRELAILSGTVILTILFGVVPNVLLYGINGSVADLIGIVASKPEYVDPISPETMEILKAIMEVEYLRGGDPKKIFPPGYNIMTEIIMNIDMERIMKRLKE